jgi:hypothetical protein
MSGVWAKLNGMAIAKAIAANNPTLGLIDIDIDIKALLRTINSSHFHTLPHQERGSTAAYKPASVL